MRPRTTQPRRARRAKARACRSMGQPPGQLIRKHSQERWCHVSLAAPRRGGQHAAECGTQDPANTAWLAAARSAQRAFATERAMARMSGTTAERPERRRRTTAQCRRSKALRGREHASDSTAPSLWTNAPLSQRTTKIGNAPAATTKGLEARG